MSCKKYSFFYLTIAPTVPPKIKNKNKNTIQSQPQKPTIQNQLNLMKGKAIAKLSFICDGKVTFLHHEIKKNGPEGPFSTIYLSM